jgi:hypothetical protein
VDPDENIKADYPPDVRAAMDAEDREARKAAEGEAPKSPPKRKPRRR